MHCCLAAECAPLMSRFPFEATYLEPMDLGECRKLLSKSLARSVFFQRYSGLAVYNTNFFPEVFRKAGHSAQRLKERLLEHKPDVIVAETFVFADWYARIGEELGVPVVLNHLDGGLASKQRAFVRAYGFLDGVPSPVQRAVEIVGPPHANIYKAYYRLTRLRRWRRARAAKRQGKAAFERAFPKVPARGRVAGSIFVGSAAIERSHLGHIVNTSVRPDEFVFAPIDFPTRQAMSEPLRAWLDELADLPVVYVSFGSAVQLDARFAAAVHEGLRRVRARVLWSLPIDQQSLLASLPPAENIRVEAFVPQPELLLHPAVRCFLTHGGPWSLQDAWFAGAPVVCTPFFSDQPYNASICELLGAGRRLWRSEATADTIRSTVEEVLANPRYLERARQLSRDLRARDGSKDIAAFVERVALSGAAPPGGASRREPVDTGLKE